MLKFFNFGNIFYTYTTANKKQINSAIENSLKNLQIDHIDIYQLHWPDRPLNVFSGLEYEHTETNDVIPILTPWLPTSIPMKCFIKFNRALVS